MTVTRMNLWRLGNDWNPTMLWYAQAVRDLQKRPITDATSWTYLAAMHGFDRELWQGYGYIEATTPLPPLPIPKPMPTEEPEEDGGPSERQRCISDPSASLLLASGVPQRATTSS